MRAPLWFKNILAPFVPKAEAQDGREEAAEILLGVPAWGGCLAAWLAQEDGARAPATTAPLLL